MVPSLSNKEADDLLFKKIAQRKRLDAEIRRMKKEKKERLKTAALHMRDLDRMGQVSEAGPTKERQRYEELVTQIEDKTRYQELYNEYKSLLSKRMSFGIDIADDFDNRFAFEQAVKHSRIQFHNSSKPVLSAQDLSGVVREFTLWDNRDMTHVWRVLEGTVDIQSDNFSDPQYHVTGSFEPVRLAIRFNDYDRTGKKLRRIHWDKGNVQEEEFDLRLWDVPAGDFFPYINTSGVDLSVLQIYDKIPKDYTDTCFVYACRMSGMFTEVEIESLRLMNRTRKLPQKHIPTIAAALQCHFKVKKIYDDKPVKSQQRVHVNTLASRDPQLITIPKDRVVELILYKGHYMLDTKIAVTTYYLQHKKELDERYSSMPQEQRQRINRISDGRPRYSDGTKPLKILRLMFDLGYFREITNSEYGLLKTSESRQRLPDFVDLSYCENLCTRRIEHGSNLKHYSRIYYADFETDPTVSPHEPYMCCIVGQYQSKYTRKTLTGEHIDTQLLDYLQDGSLTYFHNLKYDACFFTNNAPGYDVKILERTGTVLSIKMTKIVNGKTIKELTFHNSYSIISAPLKQFKEMFGLNVAKEKMAYELYTKENRERKIIPIQEFYDQYDKENPNRPIDKLRKDHQQIYQNAKISQALIDDDKIDIMKYAEFYCLKDCIVLMQGMDKFSQQLAKVYKDAGTKVPDLHNFVSISAVGYAFCKAYGCLEGCYEVAGKPQQFLLRCVSGGRTMTANNEKHLIRGNIQDFDAVSLYPSAMSIMPGIPKGVPKVIKDTSKIWDYDAFFIEINITSLKCKSPKPYQFGLVFKRDDATGSKIFCNEPVNKFYIDRRGLEDLLEFYDIEYEVIRGYYFDEGFNDKINDFIIKLFNLRLGYKRQGNPLQKTVKLLLNSIYGKSILKPTPTENKCINKDALDKFIIRNYHWIEEISTSPNIEKAFCRVIKPIDRHFNCPQFGISVLSWSKHIMNRVMCTAEQNGISIFYQDTDSMHILADDVVRLAKIFREKYAQDLIGENLTQFHCDFEWDGAVGGIHSRLLIAVGKKSYLDVLVDEAGNENYHVRLKGIPHQVMMNWCLRNGRSLEDLFMMLYHGEGIAFNILDGKKGFRKNKLFQQVNLDKFVRFVRFSNQ